MRPAETENQGMVGTFTVHDTERMTSASEPGA
jgi:hypothetical protein